MCKVIKFYLLAILLAIFVSTANAANYIYLDQNGGGQVAITNTATGDGLAPADTVQLYFGTNATLMRVTATNPPSGFVFQRWTSWVPAGIFEPTGLFSNNASRASFLFQAFTNIDYWFTAEFGPTGIVDVTVNTPAYGNVRATNTTVSAGTVVSSTVRLVPANYGHKISIYAITNPPNVFGSWSGDIPGGVNTNSSTLIFTNYTVGSTLNISANFNPPPFLLALSATPAWGNVSITNITTGFGTAVGGSALVTNASVGNTLVFTAIPSSGRAFSYWSGDMPASQTNNINATILSWAGNQINVTANFIDTTGPYPGADGALDSDGDGLTNLQEWNGPINGNPSGINLVANFLRTDRDNPDSDGDGMNDGWEANYGLNPMVSTGNDGQTGNVDADNLTNMQEYRGRDTAVPIGNGIGTSDATDPQKSDTDDDGMRDDFEVKYGLNPLSADGQDGAAGDADADGLSNIEEFLGPLNGNTGGIYSTNRFTQTNPKAYDTDGDQMNDAWEALYGLSPATSAGLHGQFTDADVDGLSNFLEYLGKDGQRPDGIGLDTDATNPQNTDTDGDGMDDGYEIDNLLDPKDVADAGIDPDEDGLTNRQEFNGYNGQPSTRPNDPDTDADGMYDGWEAYFGLNPTSAAGVDGASGNPDGDLLFDKLTGFTVGNFTNLREYQQFVENAGVENIPLGQFLVIMLLSTDPNDPDTDGDGMPDEWEITYTLDPLDNKGDMGATGNPDGDFDYLALAENVTFSGKTVTPFTNLEEYQRILVGTNIPPYAAGTFGTTDPLLADTDIDGMPDGWEHSFEIASQMAGLAAGAHPSPLDDGDVDIDNGPNGNPDGDFYYDDITAQAGTPPLPYVNLDEYSVSVRAQRGATSNPNYVDIDADGLPDEWEISFGFDPWLLVTTPPTADAASNPDRDFMADDGIGNEHNAVYVAYGFDPRTAVANATYEPWEYMWSLTPTHNENTRDYTTLDEFLNLTHPRNPDTDGDGAFDGWELYVGPGGSDVDGDGLDNAGEFFNAYMSESTNSIFDGTAWVPVTNSIPTEYETWLNKHFPTDPYNLDTDGDQVMDGAEFSQIYPGGARAMHCYEGGGLNPTSVDTDGDHIPDNWEFVYQNTATTNLNSASGRNGMDGTFDDSGTNLFANGNYTNSNYFQKAPLRYDYDQDGLQNYQEYLTCFVPSWQYGSWAAGLGLFGYDPINSATGTPYEWDWHYYGDADLWQASLGTIPYVFAMTTPALLADLPDFHYPLEEFAGSAPVNDDSDMDNMDDYYEVFHCLNPILGGYDIYKGVWIVGWGLNVPFSFSDWPTFDVRLAPAVIGHQFSDSDQDGLPNIDESLQPGSINPQRYHTDPTPIWVTDTSYQQSFVNLYYSTGTLPWYWDDVDLAYGFAPSYMFDFEVNEGYDTDNDNIADRAEITDSASPGYTDPLDAELPLKRRALYLNGNAAARTVAAYFPSEQDVLRNWMVEAWVRPENPVSGLDQIIVERPLLVENGNPMGWPTSLRYNFRLGIDATGVPFTEYTGAGFDTLNVNARAVGGVLAPNAWVHLAASYNGLTKRLELYINGELQQSTPSAEIPCNGWVGGGQMITTNQANFGYVMRGPIVVGAADSSPMGMINGANVWTGPNAGPALGNPGLSSFFKGWIDEVRIWDGIVSAQIIQDNMMRRMKRTDIVTLNAQGDILDNYAPMLLYHYSFDDLPDPDHSSVSPDGFNLVSGRPNDGSYAGNEFWRTAPDRSTVYNDYNYVPWIDNTASHMPLTNPVLDSLSINWPWVVPIGTITTTTTTTGTNGVTTTNRVTANINITNEFPNASNPYGLTYRTSIQSGYEDHPFAYDLIDLIYSRYTAAVMDDLLPLRQAVADEDIELWDNLGKGTEPFDTDGDGLPDDWEIAAGLDANDATGSNGAWGDPDKDGLVNLYEYMAFVDSFGGIYLDPMRADTDGDGKNDYFDSYGNSGVPYGAKFDDGDGMPDWWEAQFAPILSRLRYDANEDPDNDGSDNLREYLNGGNPTVADYPENMINGSAYYEGNLNGSLWVNTFSVSTYDDNLRDVGTSTNDARARAWHITASAWPDENNKTYFLSYLKEGVEENTSDANWDSTADTYEPGDPYFVADLDCVYGDTANLNYYLTEESAIPWFKAFTWVNASATPTNVFVRLTRLDIDNSPVILQKTLRDRNYFFKPDYQTATYLDGNNYYYGLPQGSYEWQIFDYENGTMLQKDRFFVPMSSSGTPVLVRPINGDMITSQKHIFEWSSATNEPRYEIEITSANGVNYTKMFAAPYRFQTGLFKQSMPVDATTTYGLFGSGGSFTNGNYQWRIRPHNNASYGSWSGYGSFSLAITNPPQQYVGAPALSGTVSYFGKATGNIYVMAYNKPDLRTGVDGMKKLSTAGAYTINGLQHDIYYVQAFIDVNGNSIADPWEPVGVALDVSEGIRYEYAIEYSLRVVNLLTTESVTGVNIVISDRDTDNDNVPDGWEYQNYAGSLATSGSADTDGDGILNYVEYAFGTSYNSVDTDGDISIGGANDLAEIAAGSNPNVAGPVSQIAISGLTIDGSGNINVNWMTYSNLGAVPIRFTVETSSDLITWVPIDQYTSDGVNGGNAAVVDDVNIAPAPPSTVYYRITYGIANQ